MPRKREWIDHIPGALTRLRESDLPAIDRVALQTLLNLSPRQALRVLAAVPGAYAAGKSLAVSRADLIAMLEAVLAGEDMQREGRRRARLREILESARRELAARRIRIAAPPPDAGHGVPGLPARIHLAPRELRIEFTGAEDLLRQLLELSRAIMNDYAGFERRVETGLIEPQITE